MIKNTVTLDPIPAWSASSIPIAYKHLTSEQLEEYLVALVRHNVGDVCAETMLTDGIHELRLSRLARSCT